MKKTITWNGIEYESISEAAKVLKINWSTMYRRLLLGYTSDSDVVIGGSKLVTVDGIEYESISKAARAHGISRQAMWQRLKKEGKQ